MPAPCTIYRSASRIPLLTGLALALLPFTVQAQLYYWKDPQGAVVIKNTPPPWYSESDRVRGPRIQVLRNGKVVDDTAWSPDKRQEGRTGAARQEEARAKAQAAANPKKADDDD